MAQWLLSVSSQIPFLLWGGRGDSQPGLAASEKCRAWRAGNPPDVVSLYHPPETCKPF